MFLTAACLLARLVIPSAPTTSPNPCFGCLSSLTRPSLVLTRATSPRNTCNRRLDLLVVSILDAMLPYYRDLIMSATGDPRVSQQFRQIIANGYMLYDRDLVTSISLDPPRFAVGSLQATESDVFAAPDIPNCACSSFHKNGCLCPHLVAASLHDHNGGPATIINLKSKSKPPTTSVPDFNSAPPIRSALVRCTSTARVCGGLLGRVFATQSFESG